MSDTSDHARTGLGTVAGSITGQIAESISEKVAEIKPKLRGWLHLATAPLTLAAGIVLIALSPDTTTRGGSAVFVGTALVLFTVSAIYHTGTWSPRTWAFLRRFDHANIFLLIAGTYTPFSLLLLNGTARVALLTTVWSGAAWRQAGATTWAVSAPSLPIHCSMRASGKALPAPMAWSPPATACPARQCIACSPSLNTGRLKV